jgi:peptidoglycan/xylan/chitin deacetylase (PgdA/CDA1 family)
MYHHVNHHRGDLVTVTPEVFEGQMRHLAEAGYETLTLDQLMAYLQGRVRPRRRAVVVTFDDGWIDNYLYAFPILRAHTIKAAVFIVTGTASPARDEATIAAAHVPTHRESKALVREGRANLATLSWDLMGEMADSGLVEFQSHTKTHRECPHLNEEELYDELGGSRQSIEQNLGRPCRHLCWPRGRFNERAVRVARDVGYQALFTTRPGVVRPGGDPFAVNRLVVKDSIPWFKARVSIYTSPLLAAAYLRLRGKVR